MPWLKSLILKHYSYSVLSFSRRTFYRTMHALAVEFICQLFIENALRRPGCSFQAVFSGQKRTEKELSYQLDFPKTFIELLRFFVIVLLCAKQRLNKVIFGLSFCLHFWKLGKAYTTDKFALISCRTTDTGFPLNKNQFQYYNISLRLLLLWHVGRNFSWHAGI